MIIRIEHARALGYCSKGLRKFCEKYGNKYGYTWQRFLKEGVDERLLKLTKDDMALSVIKKAKDGKQQ